MTGWLIALGVILLIGLIPLGAKVSYDAAGILAVLIAGPVRLRLYPRKQKADTGAQPPREENTGSAADTQKSEKKKKASSGPRQESKGGSLADFLPLVDVALDLLGDLRRKLRVNVLQLHLTMAGDDPCDLAVNYGRLQAVAAGLLAQLDRLFVIRKQDVRIDCDFMADETKVTARLELTITVGRLLSLAVVYGLRALKTYMKINKQRKGGASL